MCASPFVFVSHPPPKWSPWTASKRGPPERSPETHPARRVFRLERMGASVRAMQDGTLQKDSTPSSHRNVRRRMFADAEGMKESLRRKIHQKDKKEEDFYTDAGICQKIARKSWFEYLSLVVIVVNAFWIGYDLDVSTAEALPEASWSHQLVENMFVMYFTTEIAIRFRAFKDKKDVRLVHQFLFDAALVLLMISETWVMYFVFLVSGGNSLRMKAGSLSVLRLLRITRVVRLIRLLRALPELMILIKGLAAASRSVGWTMGLLFIIIYVFAVAFRIVTRNSPVGLKYFPDLKTSMLTLLLPGLLPDNADTVFDIGRNNLGYGIFFMAFILVAAITVMNMLIGVLVESVSAVASVEKESLNLEYVKSELSTLMQKIDKDEDQQLSRMEIASILGMPDAMKIISKVGVDVDGLIDVADFHLFDKKDQIAFSEFLELVLQLRGTNNTTVRDIVDLRKFVLEELLVVEERVVAAVSGQSVSSLPARRASMRRSTRGAPLGTTSSMWLRPPSPRSPVGGVSRAAPLPSPKGLRAAAAPALIMQRPPGRTGRSDIASVDSFLSESEADGLSADELPLDCPPRGGQRRR